MLASPDFIPLVVKLGQSDLFRVFKPGSHLLRGYADLGHEEFVLVSAGKLVSLYTGVTSTLPEGHEHFFHQVPTIDEISDLILRQDFDIKDVVYAEQRSWKISAEHIDSKKIVTAEHKEFECAMALLLLSILGKS